MGNTRELHPVSHPIWRWLAGIQKHVTTHVARHTFADLARRKGWSVYDISKAMAHSKLRETEVYLANFDHDALDEKLAALF